MKYEFQAGYRLAVDQQCKQSIDNLLSASDVNILARFDVLTQALVTNWKTYAQTSDRQNNPSGLRKLIQEQELDKFFQQQSQQYSFILKSGPPDLTLLMSNSWALHFIFTLRKPYLSQDDTDFYIIDNPVKKEWIFKLPYVAPSQWKGALRAAMTYQLVEENPIAEQFAERRFRLTLLFGDEKGEEPGQLKGLARFLDERGREGAARLYRQKVRGYFQVKEDEPLPHYSGRLYFYPTYFNRISLEVINPHDRRTGAGKQPIYFECVPEDTQGTFTLLYVPFDRIGEDEAETRRQAAADLQLVAQGIKAMMTEYGFGAKTSNGFGVADVDVNSFDVQPDEFQQAWGDAWRAKE